MPLAETQRELTPFQRQVLVGEFNRQAEEEQEMIEEQREGDGGPNEMSGGHRNQSHSSKTQAVKDSQEERERFVNESAINNE